MKVKFSKKQEEVKELDMYTDEGVSEFAESDEIDAYEEAFMRGYLG